jgi:methylmalonyl-CoA mutase
MGGMTKAIESGMPKLRIEEAAARRQARVDRGEDVIVGVNKFQLDEEPHIDLREVDNTAVRQAQIARLAKIKKTRDAARVRAALEALTRCADSGEGNLLERCVEAARARVTVGEISEAMENVWGRYRAEIRSISGVYGGQFKEDQAWKEMMQEVAHFAQEHGRRPRMLVAKVGQDGHDRGAKVIATAFADLGFDVDVGTLFQTPEEVARQAVENDVHIIGVSTQSGGHKTLVPQIIEELKKLGAAEIADPEGGAAAPQPAGRERGGGRHGDRRLNGPSRERRQGRCGPFRSRSWRRTCGPEDGARWPRRLPWSRARAPIIRSRRSGSWRFSFPTPEAPSGSA